MGNPLQHAWQWLVPPVVEDGLGQLIPRKQLARDALLKTLLSEPASPLVEQLALDSFDFEDPIADEALAQEPSTLPQPTPALLVHPQADHTIVLNALPVAYLLRRSKRRSIGFSIGAQGLEVTAPQWVSPREIESALQTKAHWIVRKLQETQQRQAHKNEARIEWRDGGSLSYMGQPLLLRLNSMEHGLTTRQTHREQGLDGRQSLYLSLSADAPPAQMKAVVHAWILREARTYFTARLVHHASSMGVRWNALRLTSAKTRWGSANTDGVIRLNWRLMQHSPEVIDYVVVHELAHLRHMDHSPQFWAVVAEVLPHWKQLRQILKDRPLPAWE